MSVPVAAGHAKVFHGWWIVLVSAIGLLLCFISSVGFTFGVFTNPLAAEFGWSRTEISLAFSISLVSMCMAMPAVGRLVDRHGARAVVVPSVVVFGLSIASLGVLTGSLWHLYAVFVIAGAAGAGSSLMPYSSVISHWFDARRGLALALAAMGAGFGSLVMPPVAQRLVDSVGWRGAYVWLGIAVIALTVPVVALFLKERPEMLGLTADGATPHTDSPDADAGPAPGVAAAAALRSGIFWQMCAAFFLVSTSLMGALIHLVPMLTDRGMTAPHAALATAVLGGASLVGGVLSGHLLDRFFAAGVSTTFFAVAALGVLLLWSGAGGAAPFVAAAFAGLGMGAAGEIIPYLMGRYFGLRAFGEIYGFGLIAFTLGGVVGPLVMGAGFDAIGSYSGVLASFAAASGLAAALVARLGPYPAWGSPAGEET